MNFELSLTLMIELRIKVIISISKAQLFSNFGLSTSGLVSSNKVLWTLISRFEKKGTFASPYSMELSIKEGGRVFEKIMYPTPLLRIQGVSG